MAALELGAPEELPGLEEFGLEDAGAAELAGLDDPGLDTGWELPGLDELGGPELAGVDEPPAPPWLETIPWLDAGFDSQVLEFM